MSRLADSVYALAIVAWVGALWAIGGISAPALFSLVPDSSFAGTLAGRQFAIVDWLGIGCATYLALYLCVRERVRVFRNLALWLVIVMLLLTLAGHFGVAPIIEQLRADPARQVLQSVVRARFQTWHGIASVLWLMQCALGAGLVLRSFRP